MIQDSNNSWAGKTQSSVAAAEGVMVINYNEPANVGQLIMDVAEKLRPQLTKMFEGVRDENGMLFSPARVRAFAINVAQRLIKEQM